MNLHNATMPPPYMLFPYTTLFRSLEQRPGRLGGEAPLQPLREREHPGSGGLGRAGGEDAQPEDRKSTRMNSSHVENSYAVFCLIKKTIDYRPEGAEKWSSENEKTV